MAKSKKKKLKNIEAKQLTKKLTQKSTSKKPLWQDRKWHLISLFLLALVLYANTFNHDYAQDDAIVIYDNMFTQEGIKGIPGILTNDTFYGFFKEDGKAKLVSGGRYRPFTQILFAIEWQIFGRNPFIGHLINALLYGFLAVMIYKWLYLLIIGPQSAGTKELNLGVLIFGISLLFLVHPVHTEAVANIKGRDEIMSMLGAISAFWAYLKYEHSKSKKWWSLTAVFFFLALMSKENAITFLAVIPLGLILFRRKKISSSLVALAPFALATIMFLIIRTMVLGFDFGGTPMELMNNPFLKTEGTQWVPFNSGEKLATILFTLGKYVLLCFFPHPLCHDYYPRAIEIMQLGDWRVILSLLVHIMMLAFAWIYFKKDKLISFGILYYFITLSIVSNVVFPIGTNMSERFLFMPSLGLIIVFSKVIYNLNSNYKKIFLPIILIVSLAFAAKTILRNPVWKNDFTLFNTDVKVNKRSAKLLNAAGGSLINEAIKLDLGAKRTQMLEEASGYLKEAIKIHPTYKNAYLLLGNNHYYLEKYEASINYLETALKLDPNYKDAKTNLAIILRDAGRHYGEQMNNLAKSESYLLKSIGFSDNDPETFRLLGIVNGLKNDHTKAIEYFKRVVELLPNSAGGYVNLGTAYSKQGNTELAQLNYNKAAEIDPEALKTLNQR